MKQFVQQPNQIQTGRDPADRARKDVIEHQSGDGKFRERASHGFFDHPVNATADEHSATLDINGGYRARE